MKGFQDLSVTGSPEIHREWVDNSTTVLNELNSHIEAVDKNIGALADAVRTVLPASAAPDGAFAPLHLGEALHQLALDLLDAAVRIEEDQTCILNARTRVVHDIAPASRGKNEYKDCEIIEHYLAVCHRLHGSNFPFRTVFLSSNIKDYGDATSENKLRTPLDVEFDAVNLIFTSNFEWANHLLTRLPLTVSPALAITDIDSVVPEVE
ncbi:MAG TPA: hypothetical protein VNL35_14050 [Chloroflexota bacterium]|nr:hypothetical protein [Chloroflexota bacterium]